MALQFYLGASGYGKSRMLQEYMIGRSGKEPKKKFLFLVPDQFTMQIQKEVVMRHPGKGIMNLDVLSFGRLYYRIMEETGGRKNLLLDDTGKNLILRKVALELEEQLPVIGSSMRKVGYIHEVKSIISEFMQYGMGPDDVDKMQKDSRTRRALSGRIADINLIYRGFLDYIASRYITTEETMDLLARQLPKSKLIRGSVVVLDGFTGFTPIQKNVIRQLLELCEDVIMSVTISPEALLPQNDPAGLFQLSRKTMQDMEKLAKESGVARKEDVVLQAPASLRLKESHSLSFLEKELFRGTNHTLEECPADIHLLHADSPREEMRAVCLKIRHLLRDCRYAYRDIAIITGDLERYAPYAEELFPKYEIPFFIDNTRKLILNPFTEYIRSGLKVITSDFSYEAVGHFLKSGLTGLSYDELDRLENYILALRIRGRKKWERMFVRYPAYMHGNLESLEAVNAIRVKVMTMLEPLLALKGKQRAEDITDAVYQFIVSNRVYEKLRRYEEKFRAESDLAREKEYSQVYAYMMHLFEQIHELLKGEEISLDEYVKILEAGITEISIGVIPQDVDYVILGDMQRSRLRDIKALFFVGLNDGIIPQSSGSGGIISDMDREMLQQAGYELAPTPREKMYIQKMYLYMNLTKPSKQLFLSYAQTGSEGKSLRPSYLVGMLRKLLPGLKEEEMGQLSRTERLYGEKDSEYVLSGLLCDYASMRLGKEETELLYALYHVCHDYDAERTETMREAAFYHYEARTLGAELSRALYGAVLENSISRLEKYAGCAYAHFLEYGLMLEEREDYSFERVDMGNVFHQVLETFGNKLKQQGLDWTTYTQEDGDKLLEEALMEVVNQYGENVLYRDARTSYQILRMRKILRRAIFTMQYQLQKSTFRPRELEVKFRSTVDLEDLQRGLTQEDKMIIRGKIDRVDLSETEDKLYVKIVDYKSSSHKIDLVQLYQGTQLQLVVYLDYALLRQKKLHPDKKILPGAMFYYPLLDPMMEKVETGEQMETASEEARKTYEKAQQTEFEEWIHKQLRMSGLFVNDEEIIHGLDTTGVAASDVIVMKKNKDGSLSKTSEAVTKEDLEVMLEYSRWKVRELGSRMRFGEKEASPQKPDTCKFCAYAQVCQFDRKIPGYEMQTQPAFGKDEAIEKMRVILDKQTEKAEEKMQEPGSKPEKAEEKMQEPGSKPERRNENGAGAKGQPE